MARRNSTSRNVEVAALDRHIATRIRTQRTKRGLTQQQLAELIGVTYQQAHKYERGINRPSGGRLYFIGKALRVPMSYFFAEFNPRDQASAAGAVAEKVMLLA